MMQMPDHTRRPAQIRITLDDDCCIAAEVIAEGKDGPARLSVQV
jgi:hypothetical protein